MFVVDTNVLVYAANDDSQQNRRARLVLNEWRTGQEPWFATWSIIYEFLRVSTHRAVFARPLSFREAWGFVESLRAAPSFDLLVETERHADAVRQLASEYRGLSGNRMHDLHIAAVMREHGIAEIRTTDSDFHQFKFLRAVDPLTAT